MLKVKMGLMLLCFLVFFSVLGIISAANVNATVNPEDTIQTVVNNPSAGDYMTLNDDGSEYTYPGHIHKDISKNFTTSLGITNPVYTRNGKATSTFNRGTVTSGTTNITTLIDNQTAKSNVIIDTTAPTVTSNDPVNGKVNITLNKVITVTFCEPIKGGTMWIELFNTFGIKTLIPITTSINGSVLIINHAALLVNGTRYTLALHTGSVTDLAGNNLIGVSRCFTTSTDGIAPTLSAVDPPNNAMNVARDKVITVTFSEPIKTGSMWVELFNTFGIKTLIPITTSINGSVLIINHAALLVNGTRYTLALHTGSVTDLAGNGLAGVSRCFTTSTDVIAPTVTSTDPANNAVNVSRDKVITVTFNEPIKAGSMWIELFNTIGTKTLVPITTSISGNVLSINHAALLTNGTRYTLALHTGSVTDLAGNNLMGVCRCFTTLSQIITNINTGNHYFTIQAAIGDPLTLNGHTIEISTGIFTENILVNKNLTIRSVTGSNVIISALNTSNPIFTINSGGSGSCIQGFTLVGPTSPYTVRGISLQSANNCSIIGNIVNGNYYGIGLYASNNTLLLNNTINGSTYAVKIDSSSDNEIIGNQVSNAVLGLCFNNANDNYALKNSIKAISDYAVYLSGSSGNFFVENIMSENYVGVQAYNSMNNTIYKNNISYNRYNGISFSGMNNIISQNCISHNNGNGIIISNSYNNSILENDISYNSGSGISFYSSSGDVNFNRIVGNSLHGLITNGNCTVNATNNWWGKDNPTNSSINGSDIYNNGGIVYHETWLMLNLNGSVIHVTHNSTSNSEITADLTHNNQGEDTSPYGTIPDGIPVNFTTTLGTITPTTTTKRGKATVTLTSNPFSGATTVSATFDDQTVSKAFRKSFSTIHAAISNSLTVDGDVIVVGNGTYTDNVVVNKRLGFVSEGGVTVWASNSSKPVFTITSGGNGTFINGFTVTGATNSSGIRLNSVVNCTIQTNNLIGNRYGIYLSGSKNNNLESNLIQNNTLFGFYLGGSSGNYLIDNQVLGNFYGVWASNSNNNTICENLVSGNSGSGIYFEESDNVWIYENTITSNGYGVNLGTSMAELHFNRIYSNQNYGLYNDMGLYVNATNNWWGRNSPVVSANTPSDIYNYGGAVNYSPWLVFSLNVSSVNSGGNASVTADLTHNNLGNDTLSKGHIPDDIPVRFTTNLGNIISPVYTFNGQATTILKLGTLQSVTVNVTASLDKQNVSKRTTLAPGVAVVNITSTALDTSTLHYEMVGYYNAAGDLMVFNWYKLAVLLGGKNQLQNYLGYQYGDMKLVESMQLPEVVVKQLIYDHLYSEWWSEEKLNEFVYKWGLSGDYYYYIQRNYHSWEVVNRLYNCTWDKAGNCTVKQPPSNDSDDTVWYNRVWGAGNMPYISFPKMLPYVPVCWTKTFTNPIPIYQAVYNPLNITYEIPLNTPVNWVSVLWKANEFDRFTEEIDLIVNGQVVVNKTVINAAYLANSYLVDPNSYDLDVFDDINNINYYLSNSMIPRLYLGAILNMTDFQLQNYTKSQLGELLVSRYGSVFQYNATELVMLNHYESFTDDIRISLSYPGDEGKKITVVDPDTNSTTLINFPGSYTQRGSEMIYHNGAYTYNTNNNTNWYDGYDGVRSYAMATTRVSDDILRYWLDQKDNYNLTTNYTYTEGNMTYLYGQGPMKAAYGTFLASLLVEYCHDKTADAAASKYNVTWSRTVPVVVSVVDDANVCYLTGESDHRMGMDVVGDPNNVRAFRYACSSAFSPIEYWVFTSLNFDGDPRGSVTLGLGDMLLDGEPLVIFENGGYTVIKRAGDNSMFLIIDPVTGIVRDCASPLDICGNFCFNDPQTDLACDFGESILSYGQTIMNILTNGNGTIDLSQLATNTKNGIIGFLNSAMVSLGITELFTDINEDFTFTYNLYNNRDLAYRVLGACLMNAVSVRSDNSGDVMSSYTVDVKWVNAGKISVNPNRALDAIELQGAIAALELGAISGITEGIGIASALGFGVGLGGTVLSVVRGNFNSIYEDPWLKVEINGKTVYAKRFVDLDPELVSNYYLIYQNE